MADFLNDLGWFIALLQTLLFIALAPLFSGLVKWMKGLLQNRRTSSPLQPYKDLRKLFGKQIVLADTASVVFRMAPYIVFSSMVLAASVIPMLSTNLPTSAIADAIVLVGFFALGRFFLALAGMDVGTSFGGMGSSREMTISALAEPAMLLVIFTLSMVAHSTNLSVIVDTLRDGSILLRPSLLFSFVAVLFLTIAECGRIPVDNPATHLELTMIHEAMILEYTGRQLALMEWAAQIKFLIYAVFISNIFVPWGILHSVAPFALAQAFVLLIIKLTVFAVAVSTVESLLAKARLFKVPVFLSVAVAIAFTGMISYNILEAF